MCYCRCTDIVLQNHGVNRFNRCIAVYFMRDVSSGTANVSVYVFLYTKTFGNIVFCSLVSVFAYKFLYRNTLTRDACFNLLR